MIEYIKSEFLRGVLFLMCFLIFTIAIHGGPILEVSSRWADKLSQTKLRVIFSSQKDFISQLDWQDFPRKKFM